MFCKDFDGHHCDCHYRKEVAERNKELDEAVRLFEHRNKISGRILNMQIEHWLERQAKRKENNENII